MEQIINKARNEYPKNQIQQFYRIIKPVIDDIFANSKDEDWQSDTFVEETNGINVARNFFLYKGYRYCFWICLFPNLSPEGKKNAFYGLERQNGDNWQALWSETEDNFHLWFKLRVAAKMMDENDLLANLNPFETALKNAPYSTDIFEQRKIITDLITEYSKIGCKDHRQKELTTGNRRFKFDLFKLFDNWYLWGDFYESGLLEAFRLDVIYDQNTSFVLFSNVANDEQLYIPAILKLFSE